MSINENQTKCALLSCARVNLVYISSLFLTIYSVEDASETKRTIEVSGHRCTVCENITLTGISWLTANKHLKIHHKESVFNKNKKKVLSDIVIENRAENLSFVPFNLFSYGKLIRK